jgi:hypothetical protein
MRHARLCLVAAVVYAAGACSRDDAGGQAAQASVPPGTAATVPHGNHDPKYGGVVLMNGDLHFEVVLGRDGRHQVYFSDAVREELPASIASSVSVTVTRAGAAQETIPLQIDESGESWLGHGRPVDDPARANVRVAYSAQGSPYWIDIPFEARR